MPKSTQHGVPQRSEIDLQAAWGQLGPLGANLGPTWANLGPTWANLGPTWGQLGANLGPPWVPLCLQDPSLDVTILLTRYLSHRLQMNLAACRLASSRCATPWCPRRPLEGSPGAKQAFDACACLSVRRCLHDNSLDETSVRSTWLQMNLAACRLASSYYATGSH